MSAIEEIRAMDTAVITPEIAAKAIGCRPQYIRIQAEKAPEKLGFPVCRVGRSTKIPRVPFLKWLTGE